MTAEVAVMNRSGIALAADSAVTVGEAKIFTSVDKLFQLVTDAPVGVMAYGNTDFMNVPWETVIKEYRSRKGRKALPRLTDYAADLLRFLKAEKRMFPSRDQKAFTRFVARVFFDHIRKKLSERIEGELKLVGALSETEIKRIFTALVREELGRTKKADRLNGLTSRGLERIKRLYRRDFADARREVFENLPMSQLTERRLAELITGVLTTRRIEEGGFDSGVVLAGFGEQERFPSLVEIRVYGLVASYPLYREIDRVIVGQKVSACVDPFAQTEMVYTFMHGIDPGLDAFMQRSTESLFKEVVRVIMAEVKSKHPRFGQALENKLAVSLESLLNRFSRARDKYRADAYSDPVMQMVSSLPKDELGAMAESLVNLTKFKRRVSRQQETVGGPIDVAVITKGDGYVWVKRKHYFRPELNPRYLARLSKGISE
jgi:hypothetical protein